MTSTLRPPAQPSFRRDDWQQGYVSQTEEQAYWAEAIEGQLPPDLIGTLFRNGPGQLDVNGQRFHHPFDGDGMISAFTFTGSRVHFRNRYVRTPGFIAEKQAGKILYRGVFGTQKPGGMLANVFDLKIKNIANTNIRYWGDKLLALWEAAEPFRLDPKTLETLGPEYLDGLLKPGQAFSAHPRIDPGSRRTGGQPRLVNFGVQAGLSSTISIYEFEADGRLVQQQSRTVPGFAFLHDFAITENYYVFFQNPVSLNPIPFVLGLKGAGQCISLDAQKATQILLVPRDPAQPVRSFDTEPCFVFHHANAFEMGDRLAIDSICYISFPSIDAGTDFLEVDFDSVAPGQLFRFELDLSTGKSSARRCLEARACEFPCQHPATVGQPTRYYYMGVTDAPTGNAPLQAIMKVDLEHQSTLLEESVGSTLHSFAPRGFINEPLFVPRPQGQTEDDGWVLVLIYNAERQASDLVILNAQDLSETARVKLKQHIPYGLHGSFVADTFGVV
ncbi:MAG: Apocarotenoid-15,15'-oxygenase [Synechococcales cyanobacterium CRU_2_2]|nr:Apocarotenoid-15,15'-oxygenase [Synechococcales cyanobacterium CRU_2_2]